MPTAILTLQYPKGLKGLPIATTSDITALRFFKRTVLEEWERKIDETRHRRGDTLSLGIPKA